MLYETKEKYYSLKQLQEILPPPFPKTKSQVRRLVTLYKDLFQTKSLGEGRGRRVYVPESGVNRFLKWFFEENTDPKVRQKLVNNN